MGILNPVAAKFTATLNVPQEVYICPATKTDSIVDVTFYKEDTTQDALIAIALASEPDPANLTTVDYFIDDIQLIGSINAAEVNKIVVGQGERIYIKVLQGPDINVRVSGVEENNPKILDAGRLAAVSVAGTTQYKVYENTIANVAYITASLTIFNTSSTTNATVEAWVSSSNTPAASDKILKIDIPFEDTTIVENIMLLPNEKIFVQSSLASTEYFVNGTVVGV
jgi:hypothetical protein